MFRKFQDDAQNDELDGDDGDDGDMGLFASRPDLVDTSVTSDVPSLKRSSVKPRVLFPNDRGLDIHVSNADEEQEEATTDIEDHAQIHEAEPEDVHGDVSGEPDQHLTPPVNKSTVTATPGSPGATIRSLRHRPKNEGLEHDSSTPTNLGTRKKHASPFDGWLRKKGAPTGAITKSKKRDSDSVASPGGPAIKKTRNTRAAAAAESLSTST